MAIRACTFDVFGTCVDWRGSVETMFQKQFRAKGLDTKISKVPDLAQAWRDGYSKYNLAVFKGDIPMEKVEVIDVVHRRVLTDIIHQFDLAGIWSSEELDAMNLVWHQLEPWKDTSSGIDDLRRKCIVSTLSNGNMRLLVDQAKYAKMQWDILLSSELFKSAKPDPKVYLGACQMLNLKPDEVTTHDFHIWFSDVVQVCMVACHFKDLEGAKKCGLKTAFVHRPGEGSDSDPRSEAYIDYIIASIGDLAQHV